MNLYEKILCTLAVVLSAMAALAQEVADFPGFSRGPRTAILVDNDLCGDGEGLYDFSKKGRDIIVYKSVDTRLLFGDMESRFRKAANLNK